MSDIIAILVDMGFSKAKAELAVSRSGASDIQTATEWLLTHEDELENEIPVETQILEDAAQNETQPTSTTSDAQPQPTNSDNTNTEVLVAKSIKCEDCGKLFTNTVELEFHATKSGHSNFTESSEEKKPMTEDEKKDQLAKIEAKLKQRRLEREAREKLEALDREKNRIRSGKEMLEAKRRNEETEMKKIVEQRKREKEEERLAKQRVRDQIEQDKLARKNKNWSEQPAAVPTTTTVPTPTVVKAVSSKINYTEVKLQIRLTNGTSLVETFGAKEPLSAVRLFVEMHRTDGSGPFSLMVTHPRKVFGSDDYDKPLESLGLAPSSVLIVSKC